MDTNDRLARSPMISPRTGRPRVGRRARFETAQPGERTRVSARRRLLAYVLAVLLPTAMAIGTIPIRIDHGRVAVLVMVLPVIVVALLGGSGPAIVAALAAALAYDVFLVEPYYTFAIEDTDEIVAAATLLAVGLVVGVLSGRLVRTHARATARRDELRHLIAFVRVVANTDDEAELTDAACERLTAVLNLRRCVWHPGPERSTRPILLPDGNIMSLATELDPDRAVLPESLDVPVSIRGAAVGRFELTTTAGHVVSFEERATAAAIAELFGRAVALSLPVPTRGDRREPAWPPA